MQQETIHGYRLSPQQKRLWLLQQSELDHSYRVRCLIEIAGELEAKILEQALENIVGGHEILRTTFQLLPGMTIPVQVLADEPAVSLHRDDLTQLSWDDQAAKIDQLFSDAGSCQADYTHLPLLRADLLRLGDRRHLLIISSPALCMDGPSLRYVMRQVADVYEALRRTREPARTAAMQYADFAEWQNELLESGEAAAGRQYWKPNDLSASFGQRLVFERPSQARCFQTSAIAVEISSKSTLALGKVANDCGVAVSTFLLACWQTVLWRSSGWENVIVGAEFDGRKFAELKDAIGLLSSYLPLAAELTGDLQFKDLLRRLGGQQHEAQRWQEYFSWDQFAPNDDAAGFLHYCFPFCFEARQQPTEIQLGGLRFSFQKQDACIERFKIKLACEERDDGLTAELQYDANLFAADDIRRLARRLETLIAAAAAHPQAALADLEVLDDEELHLLSEFNHTNVAARQESPGGQCIHELFEAQATHNPDRTAVVFEDDKITFAELNARANQLAQRLRQLGVEPDVPVALGLERSIDLIVGLLGILKAGGAYLPLDPGLPKDRIRLMLADAGARVLVTRSNLAEGLRGPLDHVVCLDADRELLASESTDNLQSGVSDQNLAYIIFTSGSTGRPKGVAVEHRQLVNYVNAIWEQLELAAGSTFATVSTIAADLGNTVLFPPLLKRGTLHLISEERATSPDALADYCHRHAIDCLKIVPSHLSALLSAANPADLLPRKRLVLGGEACRWGLIEKIQSLGPDCLVLNHYGPTEATVGVTTYRVDQGEHEPISEIVPLGRPLRNSQVFILDHRMFPVPLGAPGELHIGGAGLARGYVNRPDTTAEKFIPNPFGSAGSRLYKTGDSARYLPDGRIEFLGRIDDQVKIHGFRIEPAEIAQALLDHPRVAQSVVVAREDQPGDKRLVAYVVPQDHAAIDASELKTFLQGKLPEYMMPWRLMLLERLPLTPNGKVDRGSLPPPDRLRSDEAQRVLPRNLVEETLAKIWAGVLGVETLGIHDNFFELGGDSILSIQIIARANQAGLGLSPRHIFQHQTIAELAAVAGTNVRAAAEQGVVAGFVPLTPVQARFFAHDQPQPHYYNQAMMLRVAESLDAAVLERAFEQLLVHHDALRLRFSRTGHGWQQSIAPPNGELFLETIDLAHLPEGEQSDVLQQRAASLQASLNLEGPLMRAALFKRGAPRPGNLLIVVHHLAVDGVSWGVLLDDLQTLYTQLSHGADLTLPAKTTSFKSWSEQLMAHAKSNALRAEAPYWLSLFADPVTRMPVDYENGINLAASARTVTVSLNADATRALLQEVPAAYRTQINEVLLTALARSLGQWTHAPSMLLDLEGHGREEIFAGVDLSRTVGWFTTIFPVVLDLKLSRTPIESLRSMKEQLRAIPNRGIGYGLLRYASDDAQIVSALSGQPPAEVRFNYLGQTDRALPNTSMFKPAPESSGPAQSPIAERGYLLNIITAVTGGELRLEWTYSENIHRRETIERLAQNYIEELKALIDYSREAGAASYSPSDFPQAKLSQDDLNKVLARLSSSQK